LYCSIIITQNVFESRSCLEDLKYCRRTLCLHTEKDVPGVLDDSGNVPFLRVHLVHAGRADKAPMEKGIISRPLGLPSK